MADEKPKSNEPQPFSHSLLDKHSGYAKTRSTYFKMVLMNFFLIIFVTWAILPIYWGALWRPYYGVHNLNGWIVDFDGGPMGQVVRQAFLNATGPKTNLDWRVVEPNNFPNGQADMENRIVDERAWAAVVVASGATQRLQNAISARDSSYNGSSAVTAYSAEARNENAYRDFILPQIEQGMTAAMDAFAMQNAMMLGDQAGAVLASAPSTVLSPMNYTVDNVRPFNVQVATAVDFVGLIYLLMLAFMAAVSSYMARQETGLEHQMKLPHLLAFRLIVPFIVYFILSLAFTLLSQFFLVPFNARFGASGFVIAWMLEYCGMLALGLAVEAVVTIVTMKFISFFLVIWIISNVSVSYYPIEILPTIYRYGYGTPFYNVARATRTIIFRTRNQVGMNFGILICWIAVSCVTITLAQLYVSRKARREEREKRGGTLNDQEQQAQRENSDDRRESDATRS